MAFIFVQIQHLRWYTFTPFIAVLGSLFLFSACVRKGTPAKDAHGKEYIVIGEVDSMTGPEATFGVDTYQGAKLAIDQKNEAGGIQGRPLKLVVSDIQGRPDEGARALSKLINQDQAIAVLTGAPSTHVLAISPLAAKAKIPVIVTAATSPKLTEIGHSVYRVCFIDSFQGQLLSKFARDELKSQKVALLKDVRSDYSVGLATVFKEAHLSF